MKRTTLRRLPDWVPSSVRLPLPGDVKGAYIAGRLKVIVSVDAGKWHLSISHTTRYPSWDEIADARYRFVPDSVTMAMLLPPRDEYVNLHAYCFHLHEVERFA